MPPRKNVTKAGAPAAVPVPATKKSKAVGAARYSEEEDGNTNENKNLPPLDVLYQPEIIDGLLHDLEQQMLIKCLQIQKDADFMVTSLQQAFHLELIKLPTQVKQMPLSRFQEEYGDSLEAVTRGALASRAAKAQSVAAAASSSSRTAGSKSVFETPSSLRTNGGTKLLAPTGTAMRHPREGEKIVSANGSPLGDFQTVVKAPKATGSLIVPPTPAVIVPLDSGDVLDMDAVDVSTLSQDKKDDALAKMAAMMAAMQTAMHRIQSAK